MNVQKMNFNAIVSFHFFYFLFRFIAFSRRKKWAIFGVIRFQSKILFEYYRL